MSHSLQLRIATCSLLTALAFFTGPCASADAHADPASTTAVPSTDALIGHWSVDLRPKPDAAPYIRVFEVTAIKGNQFDGSFYGAPLHNGRINRDWGRIYLAFVTDDASGPYNHSAELVDGHLVGLTHSTGRDFLSRWTATHE